MDKLLRELKKRCDNNNIVFTTGIDFTYDEKQKTVHMVMKNGIKENMQNDSAAFEGWALALKANLKDMVDYITLDWDSNIEPSKNNSGEWRHFNRFLYRVDTFSNKYSSWFSVLNKRNSWEKRVEEEGWDQLVLNKPGERKIIKIKEYDFIKEHDIEVYLTKEGSNQLRQAVEKGFNIKLGQIKNQFPVGVFNNKVGGESYIFTGSKSAIDLYSIGQDNSFNIFEIKGPENVKIGIVSELFFYASLIRDTIDGKFKCEIDEMKNLNKVNAFFLVSRLHPLISDKVIEMLNSTDSKISYYKLIY